MNTADMTLIGSGAQADVYLYEGRAVKVFKPGYRQANARREAKLQEQVYRYGLPVPAICEVAEADGRPVIVMEYLS